MSSLSFLSDYRKNSKDFFTEYFKVKKEEAKKIDQLTFDAVEKLENYIEGGKKVRGALTVLGYKAAGGKKQKDIIPVSAAAEILHSSLLIHDDFIDHDEVRRGKPTMHKLYSKGKNDHYGASIALIVGDLGLFMGHHLLIDSSFDADKKIKAAKELDNLLINTAYGEILDIAFDQKDKLTWDEIFKVRKLKTADYTFSLPLKIGAILGGAEEKTLKAIDRYGEPVGIAFQVRDDVLGVYGDPGVTGKSNESDIREGKKTFLFTKATEMAEDKDRKFLEEWYGSENLTKEKMQKIRKIVKDSGALQYSENLAQELVKKGVAEIPKITKDKKYQQILEGLAEYMIKREK